MGTGIVTASYIIAAVLFILSLGGLSNPETARRGMTSPLCDFLGVGCQV